MNAENEKLEEFGTFSSESLSPFSER